MYDKASYRQICQISRKRKIFIKDYTIILIFNNDHEHGHSFWRFDMTKWIHHYSDVIMGELAYQIISLTIVGSTVYSGADQREHQSSKSLAFV